MSMFRTESVHGVDEVDATSYEGAAEWHVRTRAPLDRPELSPIEVTVTKMNDMGGKEPQPLRFRVLWRRTLAVDRAVRVL